LPVVHHCSGPKTLSLLAGHKGPDAATRAAEIERQLASAASLPIQALLDSLLTTYSGEQHPAASMMPELVNSWLQHLTMQMAAQVIQGVIVMEHTT